MSPTDPPDLTLAAGENALLRCPSFTGDEAQVCLDLLTPADPSELHALGVLFTRSPADYVDAWQRFAGGQPARSRIVTVDADARSSSFSNGEADERPDRDVDRVASPRNLTQLGVRITDCLDEWDDESDRQVVVCFQSITTLLQYVELDQAVEFLDVVTDRCAATDAAAHYHLDPNAHDEATVERLTALFDTVYDRAGGEWSARALK